VTCRPQRRPEQVTASLGLGPFEGIFDDDPGDDRLVELIDANTERLGIRKRLPEDDAFTFERLWRIKAAGGDADVRVSDPGPVSGGRCVSPVRARHARVRPGHRHDPPGDQGHAGRGEPVAWRPRTSCFLLIPRVRECP